LKRPQLWLVPPPAPGDAAWGGGAAGDWSGLLSAEELAWGEALPLRRQGQYWRSRAALRQVLAPLLALPALQIPLHCPPGQPPQLGAGLGWVSLSHGGNATLIAWSATAIGVDLEAADRRFDALALMRRFYPPQEQRQLEVLAPEALQQAVLRSWLAKEAAIKWRQRSLAQELGDWCFDHRLGLLRHGADGTELCPLLGGHGRWRWAAAGIGLGPLAAGPLIWPFACP
jgi:4'-phosphopantetheinyl transferase